MINSNQIAHNTSELKKIILENPDLPIVVFAGREACNYDFNTTLCSYMQTYVGKYLDIKVEEDKEDRMYEDEDDLKDKIYEYYSDKFTDEKELNNYVDKKLNQYSHFWKKCIVLYVDN